MTNEGQTFLSGSTGWAVQPINRNDRLTGWPVTPARERLAVWLDEDRLQEYQPVGSL